MRCWVILNLLIRSRVQLCATLHARWSRRSRAMTYLFAALVPSPLPWAGSCAIFHTVHSNLGPDGPPPSTFGLCGSMLVDCGVDVGRFFVAEGRACHGQLKHVAYFAVSKIIWENAIFEIRKRPSRKTCVDNCVHIGQISKAALNWEHLYFLLVSLVIFTPLRNWFRILWSVCRLRCCTNV